MTPFQTLEHICEACPFGHRKHKNFSNVGLKFSHRVENNESYYHLERKHIPYNNLWIEFHHRILVEKNL